MPPLHVNKPLYKLRRGNYVVSNYLVNLLATMCQKFSIIVLTFEGIFSALFSLIASLRVAPCEKSGFG